MAKQISLMDTLSKFNKKEDKAPKEYIVEVEKDGKEIVEVLTTEDIKQTNPESIKQITPKPFQGDVVDGRDIQERYLTQEFPGMLKFFQKYGIPNPNVTYDFSTVGEYWLQVDFPLPDRVMMNDGQYYHFPYAQESMLLILNNYPDTPPIGFYIPKKSKNIKVFEKIFGGHIFDASYYENHKISHTLSKDWHWICFHYLNNSWNFNRSDIEAGDNLSYFFQYIYYKLNNLQGVSHG